MGELRTLFPAVGCVTEKNMIEVRKLTTEWLELIIDNSRDEIQVLLAEEVVKLRKFIADETGIIISERMIYIDEPDLVVA